MNAVVTGGAGFIGSMLCRLLAERGDKVTVIDNLSNGRREFLDPLGAAVRLLEVDIRDPEATVRALQQAAPEAVCHLAAIHFIPYCNEHPQEAIETNVTGTLNVLQACRAVRPEMVVIASTAAVYGIKDAAHVETEVPEPLDVYGTSKRACEDLGRIYCAETDLPCTAVRIFNAVGVNETNPHLVPHLVEQLQAGATTVALGNLDPKRDYIDTRDIATALIALMNRRQEGYDVFNIGTGSEHSVKEIVDVCQEILGRSIEIRQRGDLVRKSDRLHLCAATEKLRKATEWRPRFSLVEALHDLLAGEKAS